MLIWDLQYIWGLRVAHAILRSSSINQESTVCKAVDPLARLRLTVSISFGLTVGFFSFALFTNSKIGRLRLLSHRPLCVCDVVSMEANGQADIRCAWNEVYLGDVIPAEDRSSVDWNSSLDKSSSICRIILTRGHQTLTDYGHFLGWQALPVAHFTYRRDKQKGGLRTTVPHGRHRLPMQLWIPCSDTTCTRFFTAHLCAQCLHSWFRTF